MRQADLAFLLVIFLSQSDRPNTQNLSIITSLSFVFIIKANDRAAVMKAYNKIVRYVLATVLSLLAVYTLVHLLMLMYSRSAFIWDEAIYSNNALGMLQHKKWLLYTVDDIPSFYNTKPPLALWLQAAAARLFGISLFSLRLPSFLALLALLVMVFSYLKKHLSVATAVGTCIIIISMPGLMRPHVFMTADLDAMLVFLLTACVLLATGIRPEATGNNRRLYLLGGLFFLAFLTKSTAVLLMVPSLLFILLRNGSGQLVLQSRATYAALAFNLTGILLYYLLKEQAQAGNFGQVWFSEYKRYLYNVMPWHRQGFFFYVERMFTELNPVYSWLSVVVLPMYFFLFGGTHKRLVGSLLGALLIYVVVISIPAAKLDWYLAPILPVWAVMLAIVLHDMVVGIAQKQPPYVVYGLVLLLAVMGGWMLLRSQEQMNQQADFYQPEEMEGAYMQAHRADLPQRFTVWAAYEKDTDFPHEHNHHNDVVLLYKKLLAAEGKELRLVYRSEKIAKGDTVLCAAGERLQVLKKRTAYDVIDSTRFAMLMVIR